MSEDLPLTYALYSRVSSDEQRERQTIVNQHEAAELYCKLRGITLTATYADDGVSGSIPVEKRPEGARMLADAKAGKFRVLLISRIDRMARSLLELLRCVETLDACGVALQSMTEPFETSTPFGRAILSILGIIAQLERDSIRERTMAGKRRANAQGLWNGGTVPFGYTVDEKRFVVCESEAIITREIFRRICEGGTARSVAALLNGRNIPPPTRSRTGHGKPAAARWNTSTVSSILHNPAYYGAGPSPKGVHRYPPLVTQEEWDAAQTVLTENRRLPGRSKRRVYALSGLLRCGICERAFLGRSAGSGTLYYSYYRCARRQRKLPNDPICPAPSVRAERLEDAVWADVRAVLFEPSLLETAAQSQLGRERDREGMSRSLEKTQALLAQKQTDRQRLIGMVRRGVVTEEEYAEELLALRAEVKSLTGDAEKLAGELAAADGSGTSLGIWREGIPRLRYDLGPSPDPAHKRRLIEALVVRVVIHDAHSATVVYRVGEVEVERDLAF